MSAEPAIESLDGNGQGPRKRDQASVVGAMPAQALALAADLASSRLGELAGANLFEIAGRRHPKSTMEGFRYGFIYK